MKKRRTDMKLEEGKTWMVVLEFLCLELFDREVYDEWAKATDFWGIDPKAGEDVFAIDLTDWEKRLFLLSDVARRYVDFEKARVLRELRAKKDPRSPEMSKWIISLLAQEEMCEIFRSIFWRVLFLHYPETQPFSIGIRAGFKVVKNNKAHMDVRLVPLPKDVGELLKEFRTIGDVLPKDLMEELIKAVTSCGQKCESCARKETCPIRNSRLTN
jgi:hypothetical protein